MVLTSKKEKVCHISLQSLILQMNSCIIVIYVCNDFSEEIYSDTTDILWLLFHYLNPSGHRGGGGGMGSRSKHTFHRLYFQKM